MVYKELIEKHGVERTSKRPGGDANSGSRLWSRIGKDIVVIRVERHKKA